MRQQIGVEPDVDGLFRRRQLRPPARPRLADQPAALADLGALEPLLVEPRRVVKRMTNRLPLVAPFLSKPVMWWGFGAVLLAAFLLFGLICIRNLVYTEPQHRIETILKRKRPANA